MTYDAASIAIEIEIHKGSRNISYLNKFHRNYFHPFTMDLNSSHSIAHLISVIAVHPPHVIDLNLYIRFAARSRRLSVIAINRRRLDILKKKTVTLLEHAW